MRKEIYICIFIGCSLSASERPTDDLRSVYSASMEYRFRYECRLGYEGVQRLMSGDFSWFSNYSSDRIQDVLPCGYLDVLRDENWVTVYARPFVEFLPEQIFVSDIGNVVISGMNVVNGADHVRLRILGRTGEYLVDAPLERFYPSDGLDYIPATSFGSGVWIDAVNFDFIEVPSAVYSPFGMDRKYYALITTLENRNHKPKRFMCFFNGEFKELEREGLKKGATVEIE